MIFARDVCPFFRYVQEFPFFRYVQIHRLKKDRPKNDNDDDEEEEEEEDEKEEEKKC